MPFFISYFKTWAAVCLAGLVYVSAPGIAFAESAADATTTSAAVADPVAYLKAQLSRLPEDNKLVVEHLLAFPRDGSHDYWWPKDKANAYDGSTTDVLLNGLIAMKGEPGGRSFCCGLTLQIFYDVLNSPGHMEASFSTETLSQIKGLWFCRKLLSPGPDDALSFLGLGKRIVDPEKALPGDFVQIWRNDKSGHSVIFISWIKNTGGQISGLQYWSTQIATHGIGFHSEQVGIGKHMIDMAHTVVSRLELPRSAQAASALAKATPAVAN